MSGDRIHEVYEGDLYSKEAQKELRERVYWICRHARGPRVLDVGCSQGTVPLLLARNGMEVVGIDIDGETLNFARDLVSKEPESVRNRLKFIAGDAADHSEEGVFDCVILGQVIEHVPDVDKVLALAHRSLNAEGIAIITTPFGYFPHEDHLHTFFLGDFLTRVGRYFEREALEIISERICFAGKKRAAPLPVELKQVVALETVLDIEQSAFIAIQKKSHERWIKNRDRFNEKLEYRKTREANFIRKIEALEKQNLELGDLLERERRTSDTLRDKTSTLKGKIVEVEEERDRALKRDEDLIAAFRLLGEKLDHLTKQSSDLEALAQRAGDWEENLVERVIRSEALRGKERERIERLASELREVRADLVRARIELAQDRQTESVSRSRDGEQLAALQSQLRRERNRRSEAQRQVDILRNSFRFRLGTYFALASQPSKDSLVLPWRLLQLAFAYLARRQKTQQTARKPRKSGRWVGVILDEFSMSCFQPEANLVTFRPDNWGSESKAKPYELLFVESAWRGNDGAWQYRVASYPRNMGNELSELLQYCESKNIPTVFWNKEDPVHFDRFIDSARRFDCIFTSDDRCIERYRSVVGHDRVFALPFAAQPQIHHPVLTQPRRHGVCFAGTYYASRHEQRRGDIEYLLRPALDYDLHIYDRRHGYAGRDADQFRFPDAYRPAIQGRLEYPEMVKAYKDYKVFLNVNSVKDSSTMFSRRVFELLACGTPVISTHSKGIEAILGDTVLFTDCEDDTRRHLERLLSDDETWMKASTRGIRQVMNGNTYRDRFREILDRVRIDSRDSGEINLQVVASCGDEEELKRLCEFLDGQSCKGIGFSLIRKGSLDPAAIQRLGERVPRAAVSVYPTSDNGLRDCLADLGRGEATHVAIINPNDFYGKHYLQDHLNALLYSPATMVGRHTFYQWNGSDAPYLKNEGFEFQMTSGAPCSSMSVVVSALNRGLLKRLLEFKWCRTDEPSILSLQRFGFIECGQRTDPDNLPDRVRDLLDV